VGENPTSVRASSLQRTEYGTSGGDKCREARMRANQAATQVKVPEMINIIDVDVLLYAEDNTKGDVMASHFLVYRGLSPWHDSRGE
jgi:hypothetical protein